MPWGLSWKTGECGDVVVCGVEDVAGEEVGVGFGGDAGEEVGYGVGGGVVFRTEPETGV